MIKIVGILLVHSINLVFTQSLYQFGNLEYKIAEGSEARLPCNITPAWKEDKILLIMWYREDTGTPIYTIDSRVTKLEEAPHFISDYLQDRVKFQLTQPVSYLIIEPTKRIDNGVYRCRVDFRQARTINRIILLQIIVPVTSIEIHDSNGDEIKDIAGPYNEDDTINITCKASGGSPKPKVTWEQNGKPLDNVKYFIYDDFVQSIVILDNLMERNLLTLITCKASNTDLTLPLTKSIKLDLNLKPKKLELTKPENLIADVIIELTCSCKGSRPGALITWYKEKSIINGSETFFSSNEVNMESLTTSTVSSLRLKPTLTDDGKRLSCSASNPKLPEFIIEEGFHLNVLYKPIANLVLGSQNENIREGSLILFECNTQANPIPDKIGWIFNGASLDTLKMNGLLVTPNTLLIENVTRHHRGHYSCSASNSIGTASSKPLFLDVRHKPFCKWIESKYLGTSLYKNVDLECQVISHSSTIEFIWIFQKNDGTSINLTSNYPIVAKKNSDTSSSSSSPSSSSSSAPHMETITSRVTFFPSSSHDFGSIYCKASNDIGWQEDPCIFYIYPEGPPEAPTNCTMRLLDEETQLISCEANFNGGADQIFHLDIYNRLSGDLIQNLSSKLPSFQLKPNISRGDYNLVIYSTNTLGESSKVDLRISSQPIRAWPDIFGEEPSTESLYKISISFFCALITILATIFMVLRFCLFRDKNSCAPRKSEHETDKNHGESIPTDCFNDEDSVMITSVKAVDQLVDNSYVQTNLDGSQCLELNSSIIHFQKNFTEFNLYGEGEEEEMKFYTLNKPADSIEFKKPTCFIKSIQYPES